MTTSFEKKLLGGLGLASLIIAGVTVVYYANASRLLNSADRIGELHEFAGALSDFTGEMQAARMTARGYVLTGDADLLELHKNTNEKIPRTLATLRRLVVLDPKRRSDVGEIERLAEANLQENRRLMDLREAAGGLIASISAGMNYRMDVEDPLRHAVDQLTQGARSELASRERIARAGRNALLMMLVFGAFVELGFAVAAAYVIRRYMHERQRAGEALRASEMILRSFYDSGVTVMGIAEVLEDGDLRIVSANPATAALFTVAPDALVGRRASELGSSPQVIKLFSDQYRRSVSLGMPVHFECEHDTQRGRRSFTTVLCAMGESPKRFSFVLLDETERKQVERALLQHATELANAKAALERQSADLEAARSAADAASAAKSAFLANMSHEIRTPMTAVVGYADLLSEPNQPDDSRREWARVIRRNAAHLLDLLNDVLDVSRIEAGKLAVESIPCDVAQLAGEVIEMMHPRAAEKGIALRMEVDSPIESTITTDPLRLRQVLVNLVGNAVKFTEAGEVAVHLGCVDADGARQLAIQVRDTGIGMTPEQLARIFTPFTQGDSTMTRRFGGTGLGLTISKRLVEMLGGTIEVRSEPRVGSTFRVSLPIRTGVPASVGMSFPSPMVPLSSITKGARILIAEDTLDMQRLIALLLTRTGAQVKVVSNGVEAVDAATSQPFDLILMDMQMDRMDGHRATAEIRRRGVRTPIIALTANAMAGDRERCLAAGCDDYLTKPLDRAVLISRVQEQLHRSRPLLHAKVA